MCWKKCYKTGGFHAVFNKYYFYEATVSLATILQVLNVNKSIYLSSESPNGDIDRQTNRQTCRQIIVKQYLFTLEYTHVRNISEVTIHLDRRTYVKSFSYWIGFCLVDFHIHIALLNIQGTFVHVSLFFVLFSWLVLTCRCSIILGYADVSILRCFDVVSFYADLLVHFLFFAGSVTRCLLHKNNRSATPYWLLPLMQVSLWW